jgi:hypothetical protein
MRPRPFIHSLLLTLVLTVTHTIHAAETPQLEHVLTAKVMIAAAQIAGEMPNGVQRYIPITGGTFEGPKIRGEVVPGGADWPLTRRDGATEIDALYTLKTHDGVIIKIHNVGLVVPQPATDGGKPSLYSRTVPKFEAPAGNYDWLNKAIFVGTLDGSNAAKGFVVITVYRVL